MRVGVRTAGAGAFLARLVRGEVERAFLRDRLLVIEQDTGALTPVRMPSGVRIAPFEDDWDGLGRILTSRLRSEFEGRIDAGRACLLARRGERVIGYTWMSRAIDPSVEGLPLALPAEAAYLWDLFVIREERGTGVGSALTGARLEWTRDAGLPLGWRAVSPKNRPSLRTAEKTGALRMLGEIRIQKTFGPKRFTEERFEDRPLLRRESATA